MVIKRILSSLLIVLVLSTSLLADINVYENRVSIEEFIKQVEPVENEEIRPFQINIKTQNWIDTSQEKEKESLEKKSPLEIDFPNVVIDDVIVYLNEMPPDNTMLLAMTNDYAWNSSPSNLSLQRPG